MTRHVVPMHVLVFFMPGFDMLSNPTIGLLSDRTRIANGRNIMDEKHRAPGGKFIPAPPPSLAPRHLLGWGGGRCVFWHTGQRKDPKMTPNVGQIRDSKESSQQNDEEARKKEKWRMKKQRTEEKKRNRRRQRRIRTRWWWWWWWWWWWEPKKEAIKYKKTTKDNNTQNQKVVWKKERVR